MWKNIGEPDRTPVTIWRMRIACWIPKATNTNSGCVRLTAFPLQQWLKERASVLQACIVDCQKGHFMRFTVYFRLGQTA
jgi:hypothetical protein